MSAKPDEYFFLEVYGSAVVEHLVAGVSGRVCALAESEGLMAVPHYSPGYTGWDIADQGKLFELIMAGMSQPLPEPLEVLPSGMLSPKKSLLAVVASHGAHPQNLAGSPPSRPPCEGSVPFRHASSAGRPHRHASGESPANRIEGRMVSRACMRGGQLYRQRPRSQEMGPRAGTP